MEHFYTIQGEGYYTGNAAYFIRLGGCDVGCVWCDVKESWEADKHPQYELNEIVSWVEKANAQLVVITGGEPLMHDLSELTALFKSKNIQTNIIYTVYTVYTVPYCTTLDRKNKTQNSPFISHFSPQAHISFSVRP